MRMAEGRGCPEPVSSRRSGVRTGLAIDMRSLEESGVCGSAKEGRTGPGGSTQQPKAPVACGSGIAPESEEPVPAWTSGQTTFFSLPVTSNLLSIIFFIFYFSCN